jgi:transposase-like protein
MGRKRAQDSEPCPHCRSSSVRRNGTNRGKQRWACADCKKTFGATFGTALYGVHTPPAEIARTLLIVMRRGSLRAAEEISGHKWETIKGWLLRANAHAEALTEVLVKELELDEVEVDAFWSFVGNAIQALQRGQVRYRGWTQTKPVQAESPVPAGGA